MVKICLSVAGGGPVPAGGQRLPLLANGTWHLPRPGQEGKLKTQSHKIGNGSKMATIKDNKIRYLLFKNKFFIYIKIFG